MEVIHPGLIIHNYCVIAKPHPKYKYMVTACVEPKFLFFLINSEIHEIYHKNQELLDCQILIEMSIYKFLKKDSYIDCTEPISAPVDLAKQNGILMTIRNDLKQKIIYSINKNTVMQGISKEMILKSLL